MNLVSKNTNPDYLRDFDAMKSQMIFALWLGPYVLSANRSNALLSIFQNSSRPVCLITDQTLAEWIHPDNPLHEAFQYLSEVHRSDYLRCYFMHLYGGGYTDIKPTITPWGESFTELSTDEQAIALGYPEISPNAVAQLPGELGKQLRENYANLIGFCCMICKRNSSFTTDWFNQTHEKLDLISDLLKENPASHPMDRNGVILPTGEVSKYPLQWTELGGNIFHPLILKYHPQIIKSSRIIPQLFNYR